MARYKTISTYIEPHITFVKVLNSQPGREYLAYKVSFNRKNYSGTKYFKTLSEAQEFKKQVCETLNLHEIKRNVVIQPISNVKEYPFNIVDCILKDNVFSANIDYNSFVSNFDDNIRNLFYQFPKDFDQKEQEIFDLRFRHFKTLQQVATQYNLTRERVRQIESKLISKLRYGCFFKYLDSNGAVSLAIKQEQKPVESEYNLKVKDLELSYRSETALLRNNIHTINDIIELGFNGLSNVKNIGKKSVQEIVDKLGEFNISLN